MNKNLQNYINHIVFVIDSSGSMGHLSNEVVKVFDAQIKHLALRSKELDQETRVTVYLFDNSVRCIIYDKDVLRLPSLKDYYRTSGNTSLIDGTVTALDDLALTPQKYGDHAFLSYVLTDGAENNSRYTPEILKVKLNKLPDNWTVAVLVPDQTGVHEAKKFGFPANNIQVWNTTVGGVEKAGETIKAATDNFMSRSRKGNSQYKESFDLDLTKLNTATVSTNLTQLSTNQYLLIPVQTDSVIKPLVESWTNADYLMGSAYYQLTKPEKVQAYKQICIQDKITGKVYSGVNARHMLNLPNQEVKVNPASHGAFDIFVQSTSVNRKLMSGTKLLVLK
jgi:acetolactate synthase regulatory subunit